MQKTHNPSDIPDPVSNFAHGVSTEGTTRRLHISGQVGALPREKLIGTSAEQMEECWRRIFSILKDAGMNKDNLVKITGFLTRPEDVDLYREIRDKHLEGHLPASTLLIVAGFADPKWQVEIEALAVA